MHPPNNARDLDLVRRILSGSVSSWHEFVERYSVLVLATLRRRIYADTDDQIHDLYVDILHDLYIRRLKTYTGRAALSTWLVVNTNARITDYLRSKLGRKRLPRAVARLGEFEQRIFQYYFIEGLPFAELFSLLNWNRRRYRVRDVVETIQNIEAVVNPDTLRKIDNDRYCRNGAGESADQLIYNQHAHDEGLRASHSNRPDVMMEQSEAMDVTVQIEEFKRTLSVEDQRVFELRFVQGRSGEHVAREMGMADRRAAYTAVERIRRRVRRFLTNRGLLVGLLPGDQQDEA